MKLSLKSILGLAVVGALVQADSPSASACCGCRRPHWQQFSMSCQGCSSCGGRTSNCGCGGGGGAMGYAGGGAVGYADGGYYGDGFTGGYGGYGPDAGLAYGPGYGPAAGMGGGGGAVYGPEAWAGAEARAVAQMSPPPPPAWRTLAGQADKLEWVPHPDREEHPRAAMLKVEAPLHAHVFLDGRELKQGHDGVWRYAPKEPIMLHLENVHTVRAELEHNGQKLERWVTFRLQAGKLTRVVFE